MVSMEVVTDILEKGNRCVLALGNFDGVHLGHRRLLESGLAESQRLQVEFAVLVFHPHPLHVLFPERELKLLTTQEERLRVFADIGVDRVYVLPFTQRWAEMTPSKFAEDVLVQTGVEHVIVGFNYSFGAKGLGTPSDLERLGRSLGFGVSVLQAQSIHGHIISSSGIRKALLQGDVATAKEMLGRNPCLCGTVVCGEQRGRELGYPTANLRVNEDLLVPKRGVYAVETQRAGRRIQGMMNIGMKPTFHAEYVTTIEVHFFDFNGDLYGEELALELIERVRDERKFQGIEALKLQLTKDKEQIRKIFQTQQ